MQYFCVFVVVREKTDAISHRFVVVIINRQRGMRDQCAFVVHGKEGARPQRIYGDEGNAGCDRCHLCGDEGKGVARSHGLSIASWKIQVLDHFVFVVIRINVCFL